jgi:hypothetical protein
MGFSSFGYATAVDRGTIEPVYPGTILLRREWAEIHNRQPPTTEPVDPSHRLFWKGQGTPGALRVKMFKAILSLQDGPVVSLRGCFCNKSIKKRLTRSSLQCRG